MELSQPNQLSIRGCRTMPFKISWLSRMSSGICLKHGTKSHLILRIASHQKSTHLVHRGWTSVGYPAVAASKDTSRSSRTNVGRPIKYDAGR